VWDAATGRELLFLRATAAGSTRSVLARTASAWPPPAGRDVKVWDATAGQEALAWSGHGRGVCSLAFSPDGQAPGHRQPGPDGDTVGRQTGRKVRTIVGFPLAAFPASPSARTASTWRRSAGFVSKCKKCGSGKRPPPGKSVVFRHTRLSSLRGLQPGRQAPGHGSVDRLVKVWDTATGKEILRFAGHSQEVLDVVFSPDGRRVASAGADRDVLVWEAATGKVIHTLRGHTGLIRTVAFSRDGWLWPRQGRTRRSPLGSRNGETCGSFPRHRPRLSEWPSVRRPAPGGEL